VRRQRIVWCKRPRDAHALAWVEPIGDGGWSVVAETAAATPAGMRQERHRFEAGALLGGDADGDPADDEAHSWRHDSVTVTCPCGALFYLQLGAVVTGSVVLRPVTPRGIAGVSYRRARHKGG